MTSIELCNWGWHGFSMLQTSMVNDVSRKIAMPSPFSWSFPWQNRGVSEPTSNPADLRQMRAVNASMFFLPLGEDKGPRRDLKPICMVLKSHDVLQHMRSL